jgi:Zn-dependent protease with chaperone function
MDFFEHQDRARRNTGLLVLLFVCAVLILVALTNLFVVMAIWSFGYNTPQSIMQAPAQGVELFFELFDWQRFLLIGLAVSGVVLAAILYKWAQLSEGGKAIAESLGGVRIRPDSADADEKRALNVVEEMALASGMPVPPVYLLPDEGGINAFAAGNTPADAVVGVTRGCIALLDRDQLQGVIAHEFSHILNGDMRLNLRLITVLHGIVFIGSVGELLLRFRPGRSSSGRSRGDGRLALLGFALLLVGWIGSFCGNLIRASVSRQREFLADASAVQFTRNPEGIAGALKVIGGLSQGSLPRGTLLHNPEAEEMSHLFFGQALEKLTGLYATHPPLIERIMRLEPTWNGHYLYVSPQEKPVDEETEEEAEAKEKCKRETLVTATVLGAAMGGELLDPAELLMQSNLNAVQQGLDHIPDSLREQAREAFGATALVFGLLLSEDAETRRVQLEGLKSAQWPGLADEAARAEQTLQQLQRSLHLPLLELCFPALKWLSEAQYKSFRQHLLQLIRADGRVDLYEWCIYQLLTHYLDPEYGRVRPSKAKYKTPQQVSDAFHLVLSLLVHQGHEDVEDAQRAFNRGVGSAGLYNLTLLPEQDCDFDEFRRAVNQLACCYPALKARLLNGFVNCIRQDGEITTVERELVHALAAAMDSPLPQL